MFDAKNIEGNAWAVTETDAESEVIGRYKVAVKEGGTGADAIAAIEDVRNPSPPNPEQLLGERIRDVKVECGRRIYAVADQIAQMNLTAAASAGRMSDAQMVTWRTALQWVDDMRANCVVLISGTGAGADHLADASWIDVPDGVRELADLF